MQKQAPTLGRLLVMVGFALSCFGLLLFLWLAFGGPIPLKPKAYRFTATFDEATQLAREADVRISGVSVGKVKAIVNNPDGLTAATIELEAEYAPVPKNTRAILRQKTLLGETYVELSPGDRVKSGNLAENASLPREQSQDTVELDEILRALDPKTREAFQVWQQSQAEGINGRGQDFNEALAYLEPFSQDTRKVLEILNSQTNAVQGFVRDTGTVLNALSERRGQLSGLIENSNRVFEATAARDEDLKATFRALPTFEREATAALKRLDSFAKRTDPLVKQLTPVAEELSPTLVALGDVAPDLEALFTDLGPLIDASEEGLPATRTFLDELGPFLGTFDPALKQLNPLLQFLGAYSPELRAFFGNTVAATQGTERIRGRDGSNDRFNLLRTGQMVTADSLAAYPGRTGSNRANAYPIPGAFRTLLQGLGVYEERGCGRPTPTLSSDTTALTALSSTPEVLLQNIRDLAFPGGTVPAPACVKQRPFTSSGGATQYPQVPAAASSTEKPPAP